MSVKMFVKMVVEVAVFSMRLRLVHLVRRVDPSSQYWLFALLMIIFLVGFGFVSSFLRRTLFLFLHRTIEFATIYIYTYTTSTRMQPIIYARAIWASPLSYLPSNSLTLFSIARAHTITLRSYSSRRTLALSIHSGDNIRLFRTRQPMRRIVDDGLVYAMWHVKVGGWCKRRRCQFVGLSVYRVGLDVRALEPISRRRKNINFAFPPSL